MRRRVLIVLSGTLTIALATGILCNAVADEKEPATPVYNPYPPGILPSDLNSELARVLREVDVIEGRALQRWYALTPPTLTGQPPTLQNTGTEAIEILGELMNYDKNMSPGNNQACASCHMPYVAFSGPIPSVNLTMIAYPGTEHFRAGKRTAQRYTYAPFFPISPARQRHWLRASRRNGGNSFIGDMNMKLPTSLYVATADGRAQTTHCVRLSAADW